MCLPVHATWLNFAYLLGCFLKTPGPACSDLRARSGSSKDPFVEDEASLLEQADQLSFFPFLSPLNWFSRFSLLVREHLQFLYFINLFINHTLRHLVM